MRHGFFNALVLISNSVTCQLGYARSALIVTG